MRWKAFVLWRVQTTQQEVFDLMSGQQKPEQRKLGLVLTGGGARAAYQVGVLKAIAEFLPSRARNPFHIISGTSAGALNAVTLAVNARHFRKGVKYLDNIWRNFQVHNIYRSDPLGCPDGIAWTAGSSGRVVCDARSRTLSTISSALYRRLRVCTAPDLGAWL